MRMVMCAVALATLIAPGAALAIEQGESVSDGEYPAIGVLRDPAQPSVLRCTATLIAPQWAITAARCSGSANGTLTLNTTRLDGAGGEVHQVDRFVAEPHYVSENGDAALLHLETPSSVPPLKIAGPSERALWAAAAPGTQVGAGAADSMFTAPQVIQRAARTILSDGDCSAAYPAAELEPDPFGAVSRTYQADRDVCARLAGATSQPGDSGGPLLVETPEGELRDVGVVSGAGAMYERPQRPIVFGQVAGEFMRPWLREYVPAAIAAPLATPTLTARRLGGRHLRLHIRDGGVAAVRFKVSGRRTVDDTQAPFARTIRLRDDR